MWSPNKASWEEEIVNKFKCFEKFNVFKVVSHSELSKDAKAMLKIQGMKKKTN
jgi:hypothetical protein